MNLKYVDGEVYIKDNIGWRPIEEGDIEWDPPLIAEDEFDQLVAEAENNEQVPPQVRW